MIFFLKRNLVLFLALSSVLISSCGSSDLALGEIPFKDMTDGNVIITLNPNEITPLAAQAVFTTKRPTQVSITVMGEEPITHDFDTSATQHSIPILGLYPDTENKVEIRLVEPDKRSAQATFTLTTQPLPESFPTIDISVNDDRKEPGWIRSEFSVGDDGVYRSFPLVFDVEGVVRWYMDLTFIGNRATIIEKRLANGNLLFTRGSTVYEYDMLGNELNRWKLEGYNSHHEIIEKPDGNFLIAVKKLELATIDDHIIELSRESGEIVNEWDLRKILDVGRDTFNYTETDWFHMNAMWYSESDDTLVVSGRNQAIVKITSENELVWILAPHAGWGKAGPDATGLDTSAFLLTAVNADGLAYSEEVQQGTEEAEDFSWVWGQHAPLILPNGNLFLFDNGLKRNFGEGARYSRGVEYKIDEVNMTVEQVWQYGKGRSSEFYSSIISDVDYLPETQNRLIMPGIVREGGLAYALVTETTYPEAEVVFEAKLQFKNLLSTSPELSFGQADIVYRSEKFLLYD